MQQWFMKIEYFILLDKPVIMCHQYEYYVGVGDDVIVQCEVQACPRSKVMLMGENAELKYYEDILSEKVSEVTLVISFRLHCRSQMYLG